MSFNSPVRLTVVRTFWELDCPSPRRLTRASSDSNIEFASRLSKLEAGDSSDDETASACSTTCSRTSPSAASHWSDGDENSVVVLSLKKCNAGPPLLPTADSWELVSKAGFSLPTYLQLLIERLGLVAGVSAHLRGRPLVPYQAVLERSVWEHIRGHLEGALTRQRAAYRRMNGGPGAPVLVESVEPRFLQF